MGTKIPLKRGAKLEGQQPKRKVKKRKYALVGSRWGMEEGAPDLGLDLRECGDVTIEQITLKEQGARTQGGGARTPQSFEKMGPFERPALATIAKNKLGLNWAKLSSNWNWGLL